jgi:hypothetical protein
MKQRMCYNGKSSGKERNCGKEALRFLHRTQNAKNPHKHKSIVCVICHQFIIGTETIHYLSKDSILEYSHRISVKSYESYYGKLNYEVKHQYMINHGHLRDCYFYHDQENLQRVFNLLLLFQWHAAPYDKKERSSNVFHSKWIRH